MTRRVARGLALISGIVLCYSQSDSFGRMLAQSLAAPVVYWKDCIQPYLMAKAVLAGVDPYLPLPRLADLWLSQASPADHPTPYPPFVGIASLPLAFASYETVALGWMIGELACLLAALLLLLRFWGASLDPPSVIVLYGVVLLWPPVGEELWQGQFTCLLLLLLVGAWLALRAQRQRLGGVLIGSLIAIKLFAWPIVLWLVLRRQWRSVGAAAAVIVIANLLAAVGLLGLSWLIWRSDRDAAPA